MAVAKSFQNFEIVKEPFEENGRMYVEVRNPKTSNIRKVRWYEEETRPAAEDKVVVKSMRKALGFENGYITIFKGDTYSHLEYFQLSIARYCNRWGWYICSTDEIPTDIPEGVIPVRLNWEDVGVGEFLKTDHEIKLAVDNLLFDPSPSEFVGSVGERIEIEITVTKAIPIENDYGHSTLHQFEDVDGNVYIWTTASKSWSVGSTKRIRGTIKQHNIYHNVKQTILTRCLERS